MSEYFPVIGLEIHAELRTRTKMFCDSKNDPDEDRPNVNICPVCMAHPGTLPVINKEAVRHVLRVGKAVGGNLADFTEFDRKNYFYPDIPKGYQISQYKYPLVSGGELAGVKLTRIHLEEDTAASLHDAKLAGEDTLLDYNRAGVPLMELVTEPVVHDSVTAGNFARELQLLLRYLGASDANMEKGQMRVEANISVSKDKNKFGTKVEVKNINSFKSVERAIEYEIKRQSELLDSGGEVKQETRGWDEAGQKTFSQRSKESAHDYRYFPDPDLPKLKLSEVPELTNIELPELPVEKRERFSRDYGIKAEDIESYVVDIALGKFFEGAIKDICGDKEKIKTVSNYVTSDLVGLAKKAVGEGVLAGVVLDDAPIMPEEVGELVVMISEGLLSSRGAKDVLAELFQNGGDAREVAEKLGVIQKNDPAALEAMVKQVISENEKVVAEYKAGKVANLQFLIGQAMKLSKGSGNPGVLKQILEKELNS